GLLSLLGLLGPSSLGRLLLPTLFGSRLLGGPLGFCLAAACPGLRLLGLARRRLFAGWFASRPSRHGGHLLFRVRRFSGQRRWLGHGLVVRGFTDVRATAFVTIPLVTAAPVPFIQHHELSFGLERPTSAARGSHPAYKDPSR